MGVATRVQPEAFFNEEQWARVSARSSWRGLWCVAHCWLSIAAAIWLGVAWPVTIPFMVLFIGNRQLGLFILMHDAAHALLHPSRPVNDWVGKWLCGFDLQRYRPYHLTHHRFVQQAEDPDLVLSAPFPITPLSLRRKMLRDLSGQTFYKQRIAPFFIAMNQRTEGETAKSVCMKELRSNGMFWLGNAAGLSAFAAMGLAWAWVVLWLLPMATWLPLISRLRNISEHALVAQNESDPLRHARTTHANWLERALIAPYWVNYHCEHHMFTQVPCWNLPLAHRLLAASGTVARMETKTGYVQMLRLAAAGTTV